MKEKAETEYSGITETVVREQKWVWLLQYGCGYYNE